MLCFSKYSLLKIEASYNCLNTKDSSSAADTAFILTEHVQHQCVDTSKCFGATLNLGAGWDS